MEHFQTTRINLLVRKVIGEFGKHLGLSDPYDLFFHAKPEIEEIASESLPAEYFEKIAERKKQYIEAFAADPEWTIGDTNDDLEDNDNILKGVPSCPEIAEDEVFLVHGPQDFHLMPEGAILVVRITNPSWTPLFYKSSALVTESGGPCLIERLLLVNSAPSGHVYPWSA